MTRTKPLTALILAGLFLAAPVTIAWGQEPPSESDAPGTPSGSGTDQDSGGDPTRIPAAVSPGWGRWYRPYYVVRGTPDGRIISTLHIPPGVAPPVMILAPPSRPTAPAPPPGLLRPVPTAPAPGRVVKQADRGRAELLTTYGDRLFRVGELKRAEERYEQAAKLNPFSAKPRTRLSQVALTRGRYGEAADFLREAETAEPGWIATAGDDQSLYAEPADFARNVSALEAHLHKQPLDRDAWLVLGAQWFLSRREGRGADVFRRLDDPSRRPDVALAAFLEAARIREPAPRTPRPEPGRDPFQPPAAEDAPRP
jgi:hypothetical protein